MVRRQLILAGFPCFANHRRINSASSASQTVVLTPLHSFVEPQFLAERVEQIQKGMGYQRRSSRLVRKHSVQVLSPGVRSNRFAVFLRSGARVRAEARTAKRPLEIADALSLRPG